MARTKFSLGDIVTHPAVRPHLLSNQAAALLSLKLDEIYWVNENAAALIGEAGKIKSGSNAINSSTLRQIELATEKLAHADEARATMRVRSGFKTKLIGFRVEKISLSKSRKVVLLVSDTLEGAAKNPQAIAKTLVSGMQESHTATAVFGSDGELVEASKNYSGLKLTESLLAYLAQDLETAPDEVIARQFKSKTMQYKGSASRLSSDPVLNVLTLEAGKKIPARAKKPAVKKNQAERKTPKPGSSVATASEVSTKSGKVEAKQSPQKKDVQSKPARIMATPSQPAASGSSGPGKWFYRGEPQTEVTPHKSKPSPDVDKSAEKPKPQKIVAAPKRRTVAAKPSEKPAGKVDTPKPKIRRPKFRQVPTITKVDAAKKPPVQSEGLVQDVDQTPIVTNSDETNKKPNAKSADGFKFAETARPVRFVWSTTADGRFASVSGELASTLGNGVANIKGKSWPEVAGAYRLNRSDEISELLQKGETWSGKTVLWPIENSDMLAPVDLAGLPTFDRDKEFAGFNGFGIIRTADTVVDDRTDDEAGTTSSALGGVSEQSKARQLSSDEANAFTTIGKRLTDKEPNAKQAAKNIEVNNIEAKDGEAVSNRKVRTPEHDVDTSILSRLPIPVLVYRGQDLLFANSNFYKATGYNDLQHLAEAGGVDALFGSHVSNVSSRDARIFHKNGSTLDVVPNIQRVPWDEHRAMLLTLRKNDRDRDDEHKGAAQSPNSPPVANNISIVVPATPQSTGNKATLSEINAPKIETPQNQEASKQTAVNNVTPLRPLQREQVPAFGKLPAEDLRNILDTASDGVIVMDEDGRVTGLNRSAEALFDLDSNDALDRNLSDMMAPESRDEIAAYISSFKETGAASMLNDGREVIGQTSQGGLVPLFVSIGKLANGKARCAVLRDITHWKKVEEELVNARKDADEANQQKSEFLAKVSHEIRTPLNAIIGFSEMMIGERMGPMENDSYRGYARDIKTSGNHVLELVNDLLDIAKIESGKVDLDFGACDMNRIVAETVALTQPQANKQRVIIRTSLSDAVPPIVADKRSIRQIILNLVSNSIKFTKPGGQVIVSTVYQQGGEVILRVRDTGVGMSREGLEKALQPFTQLAERSEVRGEGSGLGLPLTKALVEANRARFHIESEPDSGTMVEIEFPTQRVLAER